MPNKAHFLGLSSKNPERKTFAAKYFRSRPSTSLSQMISTASIQSLPGAGSLKAVDAAILKIFHEADASRLEKYAAISDTIGGAKDCIWQKTAIFILLCSTCDEISRELWLLGEQGISRAAILDFAYNLRAILDQNPSLCGDLLRFNLLNAVSLFDDDLWMTLSSFKPRVVKYSDIPVYDRLRESLLEEEKKKAQVEAELAASARPKYAYTYKYANGSSATYPPSGNTSSRTQLLSAASSSASATTATSAAGGGDSGAVVAPSGHGGKLSLTAARNMKRYTSEQLAIINCELNVRRGRRNRLLFLLVYLFTVCFLRKRTEKRGE